MKLIENRGDMPKYEWIYRTLKEEMIAGKRKKGEKLPSKRSLAEDLGVSVVTVETAYEQLADEGYIYTRQKSGCYVSELASTLSKRKPPQFVKKEENTGPHVAVDFTGRSGRDELFPITVWKRLMNNSLEEKGFLKSLGVSGADELRRAIAESLYASRGIFADPESIIIGAGTEHLCNLIIQLLGREKTFAVEDPGYATFEKIYRANGVKCEYIPVDKEGAVISKVRAEVLHISPAHHFPTGAMMSFERRLEALSFAASGGYIIEDEYDSELRLKGMPLEPLFNQDPSGHIIYMNTFSKTVSSSLRISYMILPPALCEKFHKTLGFYTCAVPAVEQYTLARFISQGYFEKHINRLKTHGRNARQRLLYELSRFGLDKGVVENASGMHLMLALPTEIADKELEEKLLEAGVRMNFLSHYSRFFPSDQHLALINYSSVNEDEIYEGLKIICYEINRKY